MCCRPSLKTGIFKAKTSKSVQIPSYANGTVNRKLKAVNFNGVVIEEHQKLRTTKQERNVKTVEEKEGGLELVCSAPQTFTVKRKPL